MAEKQLLNEVQLAASRSRRCCLFRNNVGQGWAGNVIERKANKIVLENFRPIHFGLVAGSSDLIGWTEVEIKAEMIGRKFAVFTAFEVKTGGVQLTQKQATFLNRVLEAGGIAAEIRTPEQITGVIAFFEKGQ